MSDALLNIPTGGRVEAVDKQLACVLFAMRYLTIVTRKSPEKRTPKHKALNLICLGLFICCILSMIDQKQLENMEYFNYLGSMITSDARCTREIKSRIAMAKAAFNKKKNLFTSKVELNLRKKLVKCYIWSIALYGAETWTL
jgi:hypothetical protein